jgi:hypothetical protein
MSRINKVFVIGCLLLGVTGCKTRMDQPPAGVTAASNAGTIVRDIQLNDLHTLVVRCRDKDRTVEVEIAFAEMTRMRIQQTS